MSVSDELKKALSDLMVEYEIPASDYLASLLTFEPDMKCLHSIQSKIPSIGFKEFEEAVMLATNIDQKLKVRLADTIPADGTLYIDVAGVAKLAGCTKSAAGNLVRKPDFPGCGFYPPAEGLPGRSRRLWVYSQVLEYLKALQVIRSSAPRVVDFETIERDRKSITESAA